MLKNNEAIEKNINMGPFNRALSLISGRWKMHILFWLSEYGVMRYGEIKKALGTVTHKMLSSRLKELEKDGLIIRQEYAQVPPKVEYSLSEVGEELIPLLRQICQWGRTYTDWEEKAVK
ncbi:winged helix-turn-helix transcriptional regulator [Streptococcus pantholopis]|uniref:HTH hxlR-type domain-containing protein n=1 Tax=Streptococcus pantholopis TaxID=1811193 RepID=A0A172Q7M0_9STRE|nr:helix-turn-helix domain-containing protein [Streptococcus pantholopis]AND79493.1 hypothetical protein A0O21_05345 [Streptococcus pantholopis]